MGRGGSHKADLTLGAALLAAGAGFLAVSEAPSRPLVLAAWLLIVPGLYFVVGGFFKAALPGLARNLREQYRERPVRKVRRQSERWRDYCGFGSAGNRRVLGMHIDGPRTASGRMELVCEINGKALPAPVRAKTELESQEVPGLRRKLGLTGAVYLPDHFKPTPPDPLPKGKYSVRWIAPLTGTVVTRRTIRINEWGVLDPSLRERLRKTWRAWRDEGEEDLFG